MNKVSSYPDSLKGPDKLRYEKKLRCLYNAADKENMPWEALDPYQLRSEAWVDDPSLWPEVEFPHIYVYLIDTPGEFTREKLKAFKSLEAYNYYIRYCFYDRIKTALALQYLFLLFFTSLVAGFVQFIFTTLAMGTVF